MATRGAKHGTSNQARVAGSWRVGISARRGFGGPLTWKLAKAPWVPVLQSPAPPRRHASPATSQRLRPRRFPPAVVTAAERALRRLQKPDIDRPQASIPPLPTDRPTDPAIPSSQPNHARPVAPLYNQRASSAPASGSGKRALQLLYCPKAFDGPAPAASLQPRPRTRRHLAHTHLRSPPPCVTSIPATDRTSSHLGPFHAVFRLGAPAAEYHPEGASDDRLHVFGYSSLPLSTLALPSSVERFCAVRCRKHFILVPILDLQLRGSDRPFLMCPTWIAIPISGAKYKANRCSDSWLPNSPSSSKSETPATCRSETWPWTARRSRTTPCRPFRTRP